MLGLINWVISLCRPIINMGGLLDMLIWILGLIGLACLLMGCWMGLGTSVSRVRLAFVDFLQLIHFYLFSCKI